MRGTAAQKVTPPASPNIDSDTLTLVLYELKAIRETLQSPPSHVAFGGARIDEILENWPVAGERRYIRGVNPRGATMAITAGVYTQICGHNSGRAGMSILNYGGNPATVYLAAAGDAQTGGAFAGYLEASGGSFDGKISDVIYCGPITLYSPLGTNITWGEL